MARVDRAEDTSPRLEAVAVKAAPTNIVAAMSVGTAFAAIVQGGVAHMQANEQGVLAGIDPESLHQMRVALRRLRSAVAIFPKIESSIDLRDEMKWLAGLLGAARDWDVFAFETLPRISQAAPPMQMDATAEIRRQSRQFRNTARRKMRRALSSPRYERLKAQLYQASAGDQRTQELQRAIRPYAEEVLQRRYAKVRKRGRAIDKRSRSELHTLRIAIKKLRYPVDCFYPLFDGSRARTLRARLTALQDILGLMNDDATTQQLLCNRFHADTSQLALALGIIAGWAEGRSCALHHELGNAWKAFRSAKVFW